MNLNDIDTALIPAEAAHRSLAARTGTLALLAAATAVREELPGAAYADLAWTDEGPSSRFEPAGSYYDASGADLTARLDSSGRTRLETRLERYCALLSAAGEEAWGRCVTGYDHVPDHDAGNLHRLDVTAALALDPPPGLAG